MVQMAASDLFAYLEFFGFDWISILSIIEVAATSLEAFCVQGTLGGSTTLGYCLQFYHAFVQHRATPDHS